MRLLYIFTAIFALGYLFTESWATEPPSSNEMEQLLKKIRQNTQAVGSATAAAKKVSQAMVEEKVQEKEQLKEAVVVAEAKVEAVVEQMVKMEDKMEIYAVKMIGSGIDTTVEEVAFKGPVYEAWLNYVEEGGKEDFGYFRLYLWQQK